MDPIYDVIIEMPSGSDISAKIFSQKDGVVLITKVLADAADLPVRAELVGNEVLELTPLQEATYHRSMEDLIAYLRNPSMMVGIPLRAANRMVKATLSETQFIFEREEEKRKRGM